MRWASFLLKIPDNWITQVLRDHSDVRVRVFNCMPREHGGGRGLVRLNSDRSIAAVLDNVRARRDVLKMRFSRISERAVLGEVTIDKCAACRALKQSDCFMVSSKSKTDGWLEWTVAGERNSTIYDLIDLLERYGCQVQPTRISASSGGSGLTQRQEEILQFAYSNGYYEYPRRIRLRDLSCIFNVSPSTMSEILRAGQRRVFSEYFGLF